MQEKIEKFKKAVEEALIALNEVDLIEEAKKRGYKKGVKINTNQVAPSLYDEAIIDGDEFVIDSGRLYCGRYVIHNRITDVWADIIEDNKLPSMDEVYLTYLKKYPEITITSNLKVFAYDKLIMLQEVLNDGYEFKDEDRVFCKGKVDGVLHTFEASFTGCDYPCFKSEELLNHAYEIGRVHFDVFYNINQNK